MLYTFDSETGRKRRIPDFYLCTLCEDALRAQTPGTNQLEDECVECGKALARADAEEALHTAVARDAEILLGTGGTEEERQAALGALLGLVGSTDFDADLKQSVAEGAAVACGLLAP